MSHFLDVFDFAAEDVEHGLDGGLGFGPGLEFGAWLGLASAIAVTIGGYRGMQPLKAPKASAA